MRILITGASGRLGLALQHSLNGRGHHVMPLTQDDLDVTNYPATRAAMSRHLPDVVIHTAAWTDVDGCAREPERAIQINGLGAQNVAVAAAESGAAIAFVSTNEVFDGRGSRPYYEYDAPAPANPYGYSKYVGEMATTRVNRRHYIVRTAWLFAHGGSNFIQAILNAADAGKPLRVVADEVANPTYTVDLADALVTLVESERYGTYHIVNEGACSRYDFARYVLDHAGHAGTPITRISSFEWQRASTPPRYAALANLAGPQAGVIMRPWQAAVDAFLERERLASR